MNAPQIVDYMITARCTLACPFCYGPEPGAFVDLPAERVEHLLAFFVSKHVTGVNFAGGEPFCYPDFERIVKKASGLGLWLSLQTNALESQRLLTILGELDWLALPIDGLKPEVSRIVRTSAHHFDHVRRCIELITPYRSNGLRLKIGTVVMSPNITELPAIADFLARVRPDVWKWYELRPRGQGRVNYEALHVGKEVIREAEKEIRARHPDLKLNISFSRETIKAHFIVNPDSEIVVPVTDEYVSFGRLMNDAGEVDENVWSAAFEFLNKDWHADNARRTFPSDFR